MSARAITDEKPIVFKPARFMAVFFATSLIAFGMLEAASYILEYDFFYASFFWLVLYPAVALEGKKYAKLKGTIPLNSQIWKSAALMAFIGAAIMIIPLAPWAFDLGHVDNDMVALAAVIFVCCFFTGIPCCWHGYRSAGRAALKSMQVASTSI